MIIWGIWHWRNKRVWDGKIVTPEFAMNNSFRMYSEWTTARQRQVTATPIPLCADETAKKPDNKWKPPAVGIMWMPPSSRVLGPIQWEWC